MKLYSRGQLIFFSVAAGLIVLLLSFGLGLIPTGGKDTDATQVSSDQPVQSDFQIQTNSVLPADILPVNGSGSYPYSQEELENIDIYDRLNPAVVNITSVTYTLDWFLEPVPREGGSGSGSIFDSRGYVLTNNHVIQDASIVKITLYDGTTYEGEILGTDPENDLAVIKFDPGDKELITIPFGESSSLRVGQKVLAIGNPFGYDRTLTTGIISGVERPVKASSKVIIRGMIQTDASINPGNSGGPLLNSLGQIIGINTMIYSPSGGSVGIGFAVPVDTAIRVVPELISFGKVRRGWIDAHPIQIDQSFASYASLPVARGLLVSKVLAGSLAEEAGLRGGDFSKPYRYGRSVFYYGGDIIIELDGEEISTFTDYFIALEDSKPGDIIDLVVLRNGRRKELTITLSERPANIIWE